MLSRNSLKSLAPKIFGSKLLFRNLRSSSSSLSISMPNLFTLSVLVMKREMLEKYALRSETVFLWSPACFQFRLLTFWHWESKALPLSVELPLFL